jgi:MoaA/NifB/PqqE/SkfB family radical SAM enzyme
MSNFGFVKKLARKFTESSSADFELQRDDVVGGLKKNGVCDKTFKRILDHYATRYMHYEPIPIGDFKIFSGNDPRSCMMAVDSILSEVYNSHEEKIDFLKKFKNYCPDGKNINATNIRVCTLLIAYYYFIQEEYDKCMEYVHAAVQINSICILSSWMYAQILRKQKPEIWKSTGKWFCQMPFDQAWVVNEGEVYTCCPVYLQIPIGNAYTQEWGEIWNSETAQEIRASILDGSFKYCNWFFCPVIADHFLGKDGGIKKHAQNIPQPNYEKIMDVRHPLRLAGVAHDYTCNLHCPSCRTERFILSEEQKSKLGFAKDKTLLPLIKNSMEFHISGGEPFASKYNKDLLAAINKKDFPHLQKLDITSNGLLFDEKQWEEIQNIHYLDIALRVSVDATQKKTYETIRRGGSFEVLMKNLKFLSKLRREEKLKSFSINFVVQDHNYGEMPDFVKLGVALEVDSIAFQKIYNAGTFTAEEFNKRTVFAPSHPEYKEFLAVLRSPIFNQYKTILHFANFENLFHAANAPASVD